MECRHDFFEARGHRDLFVPGAVMLSPRDEPTTMPWGDRVGRVRDPLGNLWWIMTRVEDLSVEEMEARYGQHAYIDSTKYVEGATFFE